MGNRAERLVAKYMDGQRVVGSGAYKHSNKNLLGDVDVRVNNRDYLKIEVKTTGRTHEARGMFYTVTSPVLKQMKQEAEQYDQLGCLWVHFKGSSPSQDYVFFPILHLTHFIERAGLHVAVNTFPILARKSKTIYKDELSQLFPVNDEYFIGALELRMVEENIPTERYIILRGADVQYALLHIRQNGG